MSIKINGKKGDGAKVKERLSVPGYPTVLFMDSDGGELFRIVGFSSVLDYLLSLDFFTSGEWKGASAHIDDLLQPDAETPAMRVSMQEHLALLGDDEDDPDLNFMVAMKYNAAYETDKAQQYFQRILQLDNTAAKEYVDEAEFRTLFYEARKNKEISGLHRFLKATDNTRYLETGYPAMLYYYGKSKDPVLDKHIGLFEEAMERLPGNADVLTDFAWFVNDNKVEQEYPRAIELAKKSLRIDSWNPYTYNVLAWLYFNTGESKKAMEAMKRSMELSPENKYLESELNRLKSNTR
ncbi:MAG: hypothetical protein V2J62_00930 [candidate division KSB1 bacterium]|nr:hypothetical protein [candidate division KSB1 bacterium]